MRCGAGKPQAPRQRARADEQQEEGSQGATYVYVFVPYTELLIANCLFQVGKPTKRLLARTLCQGFL